MPSRRTLFQLSVIVLAALLLDALFFSGYYASDDVSYSWAARHLATGGELGTNSIAQLRLAVNVPSGLVYTLTGGDVTWIAWSFVLYHLALVVVAFAVGQMFHNQRTGLIAAMLAAASPVFYVYAGAMLPDNATALWLGLFLITLERARRLSRAEASVRSVARAYLTAGICLGVAYSCKESGVIMTIPAALLIIVCAPRLLGVRWIRDGALLAGGLAAFILVEVALLRLLAGEWMFRLAIETDPGIYLEKMGAQGGASPLGRFEFAMFTRLEPLMPLTMWLLPVASIVYLLHRKRSLTLFSFFWWPTIFLTIGSTSLSQYEPPTIHARYYAIAVLPAMVMMAAVADVACQRFGEWQRRPGWVPRWLVAGSLALVFAAVSVEEVDTNLPDAGNIYRSEDVRGFSAAYRIARDEYPQYPVVLAPFFRRRMTQLLFSGAPDDVYADSALTKRPLPDPPFLLLESAAKPEGIGPLGYDLSALRVRTIEVIVVPARRIDALRAGLWRAFGSTPHDPVPQSHSGLTLIQLVESRDAPPAPIATAPPPLVALRSRGEMPPSDLNIARDGDGHVVSWTRARLFHLQRFDNDSYKRPPRLPSSKTAPTRALRLTTELSRLRGDRADVTLSAFGYDGKEVVARTQARARVGTSPTPLAIELRSDVPMTAFKIRMQVTPLPGPLGRRRSAVRIGPTTATDATGLGPLPDLPPTWHAISRDADVSSDVLAWEATDKPHVVQYFDRLALVAPPTHGASTLERPARELALDLDIGMPAGGGAEALVYVYGYAGGKQVAKAFTRAALGAEPTTIRVAASSETLIERYRLRVQITPSQPGPGSVRLGAPRPAP